MKYQSVVTALLVALLSLLLTACGGGGGGGDSSYTPPAPPSPPVERKEPLRYGYFGIDGDQLQESADHVTFVMAPDWGDWNIRDYDTFRTTQIITQLQEAQARGIKEAWVMVGFLVFTQRPGCTEMCVSPRPDGMARLAAFKAQLEALGLARMVTVLYPIDEPESHGLSDSDLVTTLRAMKAVWPVKMAGIYSSNPHDWPGLSEYDVAGIDDYEANAGAIDRRPTIRADQLWLLVPGGADGLSHNGPDDPQPFYDFAMQHGNVYAIVPFVWFDRNDGGRILKGIRSNGRAPAYSAIGRKIKEAMQ